MVANPAIVDADGTNPVAIAQDKMDDRSITGDIVKIQLRGRIERRLGRSGEPVRSARTPERKPLEESSLQGRALLYQTRAHKQHCRLGEGQSPRAQLVGRRIDAHLASVTRRGADAMPRARVMA